MAMATYAPFKWFKRFIATTRPDPIIHNPYAKACTPDELIAAHIVQSFAKSLEEWAYGQGCSSRPLNDKGETYSGEDFILVLVSATLRLTIYIPKTSKKEKRRGDSYRQEYYYPDWDRTQASVKSGNTEVALTAAQATYIYKSFRKIKDTHDAAKRVADAAEKQMKDNEKKWDLAESLLGMRRNAAGALVPIVAVCELCGGGAMPCSGCKGE